MKKDNNERLIGVAMSNQIDDYIAQFPQDVQEKLSSIRKTIFKVVPEIEETITYQMPTYKLNGNLLHFAAYKKHIGFYPTPSAIEKFEDELREYKRAKGSIQFPLDRPLPMDLIERIVRFRVSENKPG